MPSLWRVGTIDRSNKTKGVKMKQRLRFDTWEEAGDFLRKHYPEAQYVKLSIEEDGLTEEFSLEMNAVPNEKTA